MTTRIHTKKVLNEVLGSALAIGAGLGGLYAMKKQLDIGKEKGTGLRFRIGKRLESETGNNLARHGRETLLKYSDKLHAEAHDKIAQEYGLNSKAYAQALAQQKFKQDAQTAHAILTHHGIDPADVHSGDIANIINNKPLRYTKATVGRKGGSAIPTVGQLSGNKFEHSIEHIHSAPTEFERLDIANPIAARLRTEITRDLFIPHSTNREGLKSSIAVSDRLSSITARKIETDRQRQKRKLFSRRLAMPDPLEPKIAPLERTKRILKRTFQAAVDTARTIV